MNRRNFIASTTALCASIALPSWARSLPTGSAGTLDLGIITDLHHDIMHDGMERMQAFVNAVQRHKPDAIMQMGDFAYPDNKNKPVIDLFNHAHATRLHVIGNHDTDLGHTNAQCMETWGMPAPYYTQVINGYRFIVLNGNEKGSPDYQGGYPSYIGREQLDWLEAQLTQYPEPVLMVCHQPLVGYAAVDNAAKVQALMQQHRDRILLALNGHTHIDALQYVGDIPVVTVNSASYYWVGEKYAHESYPAAIHESHPWISKTCPYKDPLFTFLSIHPAKGTITIQGKKGSWTGPSPAALHYTEPPLATGKEIVPFIRDYAIPANVAQINK